MLVIEAFIALMTIKLLARGAPLPFPITSPITQSTKAAMSALIFFCEPIGREFRRQSAIKHK